MLSRLDLSLVAEELAHGDAGVALDLVAGAQAATLVARCGTDIQRQRWPEADRSGVAPAAVRGIRQDLGRPAHDLV